MTIIFDSTINVTLSSIIIGDSSIVPLSAQLANPTWPVVSLKSTTLSLSAVDIARIIDYPFGESVYITCLLINSDGTYAPIASSGMILVNAHSNVLSSDNVYDNPQWSNESITNAISAQFVDASVLNKPIVISQYLNNSFEKKIYRKLFN
jgi:Fe-S-cluster formation regulator IscX/YfhJ